MSSPPHPSARLLFIRLRSLGDTVLMTPALAVARREQGWEVGVVIEEPFDQILRGNPHIDRLFVLGKNAGTLFSRVRTIGEIRRCFRPDIAVDLHGGTTAALLTLCSGASKRVGYAQARHAWLYHLRVPASSALWGRRRVHTVEHLLSPLKHLGFPVEPVPPLHVPVAADALDRVRNLLEREGIQENFILIHPAAAFDTKQWDSSKFADLARRLRQEGHQVVVTAGPGQEDLLRRMRGQCGAAVCLLPPLPIREFVALASGCGLYIGNDTGTTHVAAALGKKIVVIWGSSDFNVWYPWKVEHRLLRSDLPCIPCPGYYCLYYDEPRCIRSIEVEPVFRAAQTLL